MDGRFLENLPAGSTLIFHWLQKNFEYKVVSSIRQFPFHYKKILKFWNEVIGYGSQKKKEVTGAVSIVDSKTLEALKPVRIEQACRDCVRCECYISVWIARSSFRYQKEVLLQMEMLSHWLLLMVILVN
jgi:hypothetical protein